MLSKLVDTSNSGSTIMISAESLLTMFFTGLLNHHRWGPVCRKSLGQVVYKPVHS